MIGKAASLEQRLEQDVSATDPDVSARGPAAWAVQPDRLCGIIGALHGGEKMLCGFYGKLQ